MLAFGDDKGLTRPHGLQCNLMCSSTVEGLVLTVSEVNCAGELQLCVTAHGGDPVPRLGAAAVSSFFRYEDFSLRLCTLTTT